MSTAPAPSAIELAAMRRAIDLAALGAATTLPNPVVGAVLLDRAGATIGEGWHRHPGGPHAEVEALNQAGEKARGATAVVTLEPCDHTGRTGPCSEALLAAGVTRVLIGVGDPHERAAGGAARLRAAGVEVVEGVLADEAELVNEPWLVATRRRRPFVTWKVATSLDGRVAAADGTSRWITGEAARADVHRLRAQVDTMLVGVGTVLADDPHLTVRDAAGALVGRQPLRVVADSRGRTPLTARVRDGAAPTWIVSKDAEASSGESRNPPEPGEPGEHPGLRGQVGVDLEAMLRRLYAEHDRRHVLLEGGPRLAGEMVRLGLVDRVVAYVAPVLLGEGPAALGPAGVTTIGGAWRLETTSVERVGDDVRLRARLRRPAPPSPGHG